MIKKIALFLISLKVKSDNSWDYRKKIDMSVDSHSCTNIVITVRARNFIKIFRVKIIRIGLD